MSEFAVKFHSFTLPLTPIVPISCDPIGIQTNVYTSRTIVVPCISLFIQVHSNLVSLLTLFNPNRSYTYFYIMIDLILDFNDCSQTFNVYVFRLIALMEASLELY